MTFKEIINDKKFITIISFFDLISFILANTIIFLLINYFYNFRIFSIEGIIISFIFFISGLILNLIILKTEFLIDFGRNKKENLEIIDADFEEKLEENKNELKTNQKKNENFFNFGKLNLFVICLRLFFFNILKFMFA